MSEFAPIRMLWKHRVHMPGTKLLMARCQRSCMAGIVKEVYLRAGEAAKSSVRHSVRAPASQEAK